MTADELTSDAITASFRLIQRRRGHRFSVDDLATAWEAARVAPPERRASSTWAAAWAPSC